MISSPAASRCTISQSVGSKLSLKECLIHASEWRRRQPKKQIIAPTEEPTTGGLDVIRRGHDQSANPAEIAERKGGRKEGWERKAISFLFSDLKSIGGADREIGVPTRPPPKEVREVSVCAAARLASVRHSIHSVLKDPSELNYPHKLRGSGLIRT